VIDSRSVLACPMPQPNDAGAATVGDYLGRLLCALWQEGDAFSSKRPFGNSGWRYDLAQPLIAAFYVTGILDEEGDVVEVDEADLDATISAAIDAAFHDYQAATTTPTNRSPTTRPDATDVPMEQRLAAAVAAYQQVCEEAGESALQFARLMQQARAEVAAFVQEEADR
jgi:HAMP domain-containing protein